MGWCMRNPSHGRHDWLVRDISSLLFPGTFAWRTLLSSGIPCPFCAPFSATLCPTPPLPLPQTHTARAGRHADTVAQALNVPLWLPLPYCYTYPLRRRTAYYHTPHLSAWHVTSRRSLAWRAAARQQREKKKKKAAGILAVRAGGDSSKHHLAHNFRLAARLRYLIAYRSSLRTRAHTYCTAHHPFPTPHLSTPPIATTRLLHAHAFTAFRANSRSTKPPQLLRGNLAKTTAGIRGRDGQARTRDRAPSGRPCRQRALTHAVAMLSYS